jgi:hypothetical protein
MVTYGGNTSTTGKHTNADPRSGPRRQKIGNAPSPDMTRTRSGDNFLDMTLDTMTEHEQWMDCENTSGVPTPPSSPFPSDSLSHLHSHLLLARHFLLTEQFVTD